MVSICNRETRRWRSRHSGLITRHAEPRPLLRRRTRRAAFTLIEILIVIAIIVALGGLVAVGLLGKKKQAKVGLAQADMNTLKQALKSFHLNYERFPTEEIRSFESARISGQIPICSAAPSLHTFRCMEIAEEEIDAAKARHPLLAARLHDGFRELCPPAVLREAGP